MPTKVDYNEQTGKRRSLYPASEDYILKAIHADDSQKEKGEISFLLLTANGNNACLKLRFLSKKIVKLHLFLSDSKGQALYPIRNTKQVFSFPKNGDVPVTFRDGDNAWIVETGDVTLSFRKDYWKMEAFVKDEKILEEGVTDANVDNRWKMLPLGFTLEEGKPVAVRENFTLGSNEAIWGLGEKYTSMNRRGRVYHIRQVDALSTDSEKAYLGEPFYLSSKGYGLFCNSFSESMFDVGASSTLSLQIGVKDADLDLVLILEGKEKYREIIEDYIELTGEVPLIPKWALGYWQSKCTYHTQDEVMAIAEQADKLHLPIDVIHIDDWQGAINAGTLKWDKTAFPNPVGMIHALHEKHIHLSVWTFPYVNDNCPEFCKLEEQGFFVRNTRGETALFYATADSKNKVACYDFTNPAFVAWYRERIFAILRDGVDVIKTDFSEALPEDVILFDGSTGTEAHNKIPFLYTNLIYDTMREAFKGTEKIPLIWSRSGYLGAHRIPAIWAGDSSSESAGLSALIHGGLGLSACGTPYWGYDLGGFFLTGLDGNECLPSEEQYLRSFVTGMFLPLARAHGKTAREPWNISENALEVARKYDVFRHRLIPYLWHTAIEAHLTGIPMLRPLYFEYPGDRQAVREDLEYMLGDSLLVCPPFERSSYRVYLPKGRWTNLFTGEVLQGGTDVEVHPKIDEIPVFVRDGSVLEMLPEESNGVWHVSAGEAEKTELLVFTGRAMEKTLYDAVNRDGKVLTMKKQISVLQREDGSLYIPEEIGKQYHDVKIL